MNLRGEAVVGEDGRFSVSLTLPLTGPDGQARPFDLTVMVRGSWTAGEGTVQAVPDSAARTVTGLSPDHPDLVPTVVAPTQAPELLPVSLRPMEAPSDTQTAHRSAVSIPSRYESAGW